MTNLYHAAAVVLAASIAGATALAAQTNAAKTGTFTGVVTRDTLGHPVANAEVSVPELSRTTLANAQGEFRFTDIAAGRHTVVVRAIGFQLLATSIDVTRGNTLDLELSLLPIVVRLDSVRTTASARSPILPKYEEFEARARAQISGYFLTDSMLRRRDRDNLEEVISGMVPSVDDRGGTLFSTHGGNSAGPVFGNMVVTGAGSASRLPATPVANTATPATNGGLGGLGPCPFTVYLDGIKIFQAGDKTEGVDFRKLRVEDFYGVEVYPSIALAPAQYTTTGSNCGVIVLWTRPLNHP
ncbi:MAG TPA: carboxypeptidase-like regulatory domain-containing protein [Gemmatimonadaceae bacterium]|jgi:hypothetical protein